MTGAPPTSPKILIVDDEPNVLRSTEMILRVLGYEGIPLPDPTEVVEVAAREQPALILQDLKMEHLDLPRLVRRLRAHQATKDIPIVFFSAAPNLQQIAAELDAAGYLKKPFGSDQLSRLLRQAIPLLSGASPAGASQAQFDQAVDGLFHEYWNVFTSVSSTAQVLSHGAHLKGRDKGVVDQIDRLLIKIEREAGNIRNRLKGMYAASRAS